MKETFSRSMPAARWATAALAVLGLFLILVAVLVPEKRSELLKAHGAAYLLSSDGNNMWYNKPNAVHFADGSVLVSWLGRERSAMLSRIDFDAGRMSHMAAYEWHYQNDHSEPAIIESGSAAHTFISVFCLHNSPLMIRRFDLESKTKQILASSVETLDHGQCTYPQLVELDRGEIAVVYRKGRGGSENTKDLAYLLSDDGGQTWSKPKILVYAEKGGWIYAHANKGEANRLALTFSVYDPDSEKIEDVYFAEIDLKQGVARLPLSGEFPVPIDVLAPALAYQTPSKVDARTWDYFVDEQGMHYLLLVSKSEATTSLKRLVFDRDYKMVSSLKLGDVGVQYYPCGAVFLGTPNRIVVSRPNRGQATSLSYLDIDDYSYDEAPIFLDAGESLCRPEYLGGERHLLSFTNVHRYESHLDFETSLFLGSLSAFGLER